MPTHARRPQQEDPVLRLPNEVARTSDEVFLPIVVTGSDLHPAGVVLVVTSPAAGYSGYPSEPPMLSPLATGLESLGFHPPTRDRVSELESLVQTLEAQVEALARRVLASDEAGSPQVVVLREIERDQAKVEVLAYFREHPDSYPSDAAAALRMDAALVRDLASELVSEGRLEA